MSEEQQARFEGWAIVDVLGHQRYVGYVTTEAYGQAVLFRVDVPALAERERVTKRPGHVGDYGYAPAGSTVKEAAVPGYTKLIGSGSIYTLTPCTEEAALEAVEQMQARPLMLVALPPDRALPEKGAEAPYDDVQLQGAGETEEDDDPGDVHDDPDDDATRLVSPRRRPGGPLNG